MTEDVSGLVERLRTKAETCRVDEVDATWIEDLSEAADALASLSLQLAAVEGHSAALAKINDIRNSIIGFQTMNWSEHIYPLVAALNEAGIEGQGYPEAREYVGTMLERTLAAENKVDGLRAALKLAIDHIEHMAAWFSGKGTGYSFESLGEDMPGIKAALSTTEGSENG